jgi:hypothetical protein
MNPQFLLSVKFWPSNCGGRKGPVKGEYYACPLLLGEEAFDCRLLLNGTTLELGSTYEVPAVLLNPEAAHQKILLGTRVRLWEGREVGEAVVVKVFDRPESADGHPFQPPPRAEQ